MVLLLLLVVVVHSFQSTQRPPGQFCPLVWVLVFRTRNCDGRKVVDRRLDSKFDVLRFAGRFSNLDQNGGRLNVVVDHPVLVEVYDSLYYLRNDPIHLLPRELVPHTCRSVS